MNIPHMDIKEQEILDLLKSERILTLATCAGNRVTIRPMSHINEGLNVFFQTGKESLKMRQIKENPNVALCIGTYELEGTASELGHPLAEKNKSFAKAYKEKHPDSFERYSAYEEEIVVKVSIHRVRQWRYIDGKPFLAEAEFNLPRECHIDSRCGLHCTGCTWKASCGCGGCIETNGHPFHGECPIAICCQGKGHVHCGECDNIPCDKLYSYSYLDPEHGDKPQGARVEVCRGWAAGSDKQAWKNVLLTSAGFEDMDGMQKPNIVHHFLEMLVKSPEEAKVLFIPTAAITDEARKMADGCFRELVGVGISPENITAYDVDGSLSADEAMHFDVIYFTGGDTAHLLRRMKETGFDAVVKKMVYADKVYVGVSAGSIIATPNIGDSYDKDTAGLCLVNTYLSVHCPSDMEPRTDLPLPHILLTDNQALSVSWRGYKVIEG